MTRAVSNISIEDAHVSRDLGVKLVNVTSLQSKIISYGSSFLIPLSFPLFKGDSL